MLRTLIAVGLVAVSQMTLAVEKRNFCVFDPLGANGSLFGMSKDYGTMALEWGVDFHLHAYTDEKIAVDDFKAEQCDAVLMTGARARPFNKFAATIEAIGAVPTESVMRDLVATVSSPKAAKYMTEGRYEVGGILPAGPIYLFVRDRNIDSVEELSGKRIATFEYDEPSIKLVNHVGASVVPANSANFSGKFNNGSVDAAYAPALAYKPLEMYKGLGNKGGILNFNLAYLDFQIILHKERFPEGFGQKSREKIASVFDRMSDYIKKDTAEIDKKYWVNLAQADQDKYNLMLRSVRVNLRDEGVYDSNMLRLMRKLRCGENPAAAECVEKLE
ncbi:putative solute-binding protein [Thalassolituus sp. LLYu03]|uniref:putative solute-binding protein n=1 Tax=Thalassolituus sp. LLYu03 TaxID=3421656 RepID=UPI003D2742C1